MHIPLEIENTSVKFDYVVGYTLLEMFHDQSFIDNFRYNITMVSDSINMCAVQYFIMEIILIIASLNNGELKNTFKELLVQVL